MVYNYLCPQTCTSYYNKLKTSTVENYTIKEVESLQLSYQAYMHQSPIICLILTIEHLIGL